LTNDEDVSGTGGELTAGSVLDVDNVETTSVALLVGDDTNTAHVTASNDAGNVSNVELDEGLDLSRLNVDLDGVADLDQRIRVADGAAVVGDNEGNTAGTDKELLDGAELVLGLLRGDLVDGEAALGVVQETEVLAGLLDGDDVCKYPPKKKRKNVSIPVACLLSFLSPHFSSF
jgi:hypothetical protein